MGNSRKLGMLESFYAHIHEKLTGHNTTSVIVKLSGEINSQLYNSALKALFERHPMLRATILGDDNGYSITYNAIFESIPIQSEEYLNEYNWNDAYLPELNTPLELNKFCWRSKFLFSRSSNISYVLLTFCHAIADGLSIAVIVREFLSFANKILRHEILDISTLPALLPIESILLQRGFLKNVENNKHVLWDKNPIWPYQVKDKNTKLWRTNNVIRNIDKETVKNLIAKSREMKLTINELLTGLYINTIQHHAPQDIRKVSLFTPVNLRGVSSPEIPLFNIFSAVTPVITHHDISFKNFTFKEHAYEYQKNFHERFNDLANNFLISSYDDIDSYVKYSLSNRDGFFMGFGITNLGRFDFGTTPADPLQMDSFIFSGSRRGGDCVMLLCIITNQTGMTLIFNYTEPLLKNEWVENFSGSFINNVKELAS